MTRFALGFLIILANLGVGVVAWGQAPATGAPPAEGEPKPDLPTDTSPVDPLGNTPTTATDQPAGPRKPTYDDIVVVPRKAFLKGGRLELAPFTAMSLNDVLIRHYGFGGDLNFYLTDVFSIGLQGQYFVKERSDRESLVGLQYNRTATLNRLKYGAALNFGYVPGYGKFTLFNKYILHWDILVSAGVGVIWTEIIPRIVGNEAFSNTNIAPNFAVGTRFFLNNWLTMSFAFRDYVFNDKFEPLTREPGQDIATVKSNAQSQLINNIMFSASLGFYLPTSFQYRTPR
jgi:outer membrane beta-barrel protein